MDLSNTKLKLLQYNYRGCDGEGIREAIMGGTRAVSNDGTHRICGNNTHTLGVLLTDNFSFLRFYHSLSLLPQCGWCRSKKPVLIGIVMNIFRMHWLLQPFRLLMLIMEIREREELKLE